MKRPFSRTHVVQYGLLVFCAMIVLGAAVLTIREIPTRQANTQREIAYAATATHIAQPTHTPSPTALLLPTPLSQLSPAAVLLPTAQDLHILPTVTPDATLPPGVPARAPLLPQHDTYDLVNFLVLGSDRYNPSEAYRTDVIILVSVNRSTQTVNLLSIPRDLYVYIPGWGMDRINTAELHQSQTHATSHRLGLLAETVEYNLGVRVDHLARIDFAGFETLIDLFGGVTVPVDCPVSGYQPADDNSGQWVPFVLEPGLHQMNGALALWYVRQRMDSSDFDRNRRQQIVLRALWHKIADNNLIRNFPVLWDQATRSIETDLAFDQALGFVPLLLNLDSTRIESHFLGLDEVNLWVASGGANVLVIDPEPFARTMTNFMTPPTENHLVQEQARVGVLNGSSTANADQLAAAQLQWAGLIAVSQGISSVPAARTTVYDHTGRVKGSSLGIIQTALNLSDADSLLAQDASSDFDFTVVIGDNYQSCSTSPWRAFSQPD